MSSNICCSDDIKKKKIKYQFSTIYVLDEFFLNVDGNPIPKCIQLV